MHGDVLPGGDDATLVLFPSCRLFGWTLGELTRSVEPGAVVVFVVGAVPEAFRAEFEGMPEFDFSSCDPPWS